METSDLQTERLICSSGQVLTLFSDIEALSIHFASLGTPFSLDPACSAPPEFTGEVAASLSIHSDQSCLLTFYPIRREALSAALLQEFAERLLPQMRVWLGERLEKKDSSARAQFLVEMGEDSLNTHELRYE
jgi:hypothetical protein